MANSPRPVPPSPISDLAPTPLGTDTPTPAEMRDPGAHDRGGWLTVDEACKQFGIDRDLLVVALNEGRIAGRPVAEERLSPKNADADTVVPEGQQAPDAPRDEWLVQPDQVEKLLKETRR